MSKRWNIGSQLGSWTLTDFLGKGGNGEVWGARNDARDEGALKILSPRHNSDRKRYKRFCREVAVLNTLQGEPGILPLLDSSTPDNPTPDEPAWLVTGRAMLIREAFGAGSNLRQVVEAVAGLAEALASVHGRGISHRDIKPDNLFLYRGQWALGDFGLADVLGKESITADEEKLGPLYFMAPEMLESAAEADGRPADVYSLGKTLWVLAVGQNFPPPGELRLDVPQLTLAAHVNDPRTYYLDRLLERMTKHNPAARPPMDEVAIELRAWLASPLVPVATEDLSFVAARIVTSSTRFQHAESARREQIRLATEATPNLKSALTPLLVALTGAGFHRIEVSQSGGRLPDILFQVSPPKDDHVTHRGAEVVASTAGLHAPQFISALGFLVRTDGMAEIGAAHFATMNPLNGPTETLWSERRQAVLGSAGQDCVVEALAAALAATLPAALEAFARMLEELS